MPSIYSIDNDKVVGFKKEAKTIINQLIHPSKERQVILITGMGGLGKTTLAKRVYNEEKVANQFDTRAWCTISQEYDCKDLLRNIYREVCGSEIEIDSVAEELCKRLKVRRYLIVLDDIWSVEAWEKLERAFPSCDNRSRIVLTSREEIEVCDAKHIIRLPFFTTEESWELLKVKLFKGNRCLEELENVGREISNKCKGLSLTIGLIAGLLEKVEKSEQKWHEFLLTLNSHVTFGEGIESNDAIKFSYDHLSRHLKPCLLYLVAFPEDEKIEVEKLIQLWICEGFIEKGVVEDEAEGYLNHLVCSNLIMVSEKKYDGRITRCTIHDLVRDFCLIKAKEENFLEVIDLEKKLDQNLNFTSHRICFHRQGDSNIPDGFVPQNSSIGTVLIFEKHISTLDYDSWWIILEFKHLTILDLEKTEVNVLFLDVVNSSLIHLRYLTLFLIDEDVGGDVSPLSLGNLECLITLKLTTPILHLPVLLLNMRSLRHMIIIDYCAHGYKDCMKKSRSEFEAIPYSECLQTWIFPCALTTEDEHLLRKFPYLKTLSCGVSKYPFPEIGFLHHLEYLTLSSDLENDLKFSNFPSSIKKIKLKLFKVSVSAISIFAQLPNLEALTLRSCEFEEDSEWNLEEGTQFRKLKYLKLSFLDIRIWNVSSAADESFPCLETLHLKFCRKLEDLPSSFEYVPNTLKEISVKGCNQNVDSWAEKILEYARNMGNKELNVKIYGRRQS